MKVLPAVLVKDYSELLDKLTLLKGVSSCVQIDLCDGVFGKTKTFLPEENLYLPPDFEYEFDVMMFSWELYIPICISLGAKKIVAHVDNFTPEDCDKLLSFFDLSAQAEGKGIELGISVSNDISVKENIGYIKYFKDKKENIFVQIMGIKNIGAQGESFDDTCLERIKEIKKTFPDILIQVDGSMNEDTIKKVKDVGIGIAVVGSYLFKSGNLHDKLKSLERV